MADVSRRSFLARSSVTLGAVSVGLAGGLGVRQLFVARPTQGMSLEGVALSAVPLAPAAPLETMIVHIRDIAGSEIALMVGTREVVFSDPQLVGRLVQAAQAAEG